MRIHKFGKQDLHKTDNEIYDDYGNTSSFKAMCDLLNYAKCYETRPESKRARRTIQRENGRTGILSKKNTNYL